MNRNSFLIIIFVLLNLNCKSLPNNDLIFENKDKKIELHVAEKQIIIDEENQIKIEVTNIKPNNLVVVGVGVSIIDIQNDIMTLRILSRSEYHKDKKDFELKISYKEGNERINHTFFIPFKKQ